MATDDPFDLKRFVVAQGPIYDTVVRELNVGRKQTHWMWFIFPQLRGLGRSTTAQFFAISSLAEARAYLTHPQLGTRLVACVEVILRLRGRSLAEIFGSPDDMKFRSSMTLFACAADDSENIFNQAIQYFCGGIADERTLALLNE